MFKRFLSTILAFFSGSLLLAQEIAPGENQVDQENTFLSSWWFLAILLITIVFVFFLIFDKSSTYNRELFKGSSDGNRMKEEEVRVYILFLSFIVPSSEIIIHFFQLRQNSELIPNLLIGGVLISLFILSGKFKGLRKWLYTFLLGFFLLFCLSTLYKMLVLPFELIHFGEWMICLFFSIYIFQNQRYYWLFILVQIGACLSLWSNPKLSNEIILLHLMFAVMIIILNHIKYLVQSNYRKKLIFTNRIVHEGKSIVISSDKDGRINFISDNVREILGYEPEELLGNGWWEKTIDQNTRHENERKRIINLYLNEEASTRMIRTASGSYKWIQWHDKRMNEDLVVGIGQDITELRRHELEAEKRHQKFELQQSVINELNLIQFKQQDNLDQHIELIISKTLEGIEGDRVNIWEYHDQQLESKSLYLKKQNEFQRGEILYQKNCPNYFKTLLSGQNIIANDAINHEATHEFKDGYLSQFGIQSLINVPIFIRGQMSFVFCIETQDQRVEWDSNDINFAKTVANLISISIENQKRIEAERQTRASEEMYRQINETIDSVFWLFDLERDRIQYISPSCKDIFGQKQEHFYQNATYWKSFVHEDDLNIVLTAHQMIQSTGHFEVEYRIRKGDQIRWIKEKAFSVRNEQGNVNKISGICSDITNEVSLQQELKQLSLVAEKTTNGVLITDENGQVMWSNQGFLDMMEVGFENLIGRRPRDIFLDTERDDYQFVYDGFDDRNFYVELEVLTFKKNRKWVSINNTVLLDDFGNVAQQIEIISDITERVRNTEKIALQSKELESYAQELEFQNTLKEMLMQTQSIQDVTLNALAFIFVQLENAHHIAMMFPDSTERFLSGYFLEEEELQKEEFPTEQINSYGRCKQGEIVICEDLLEKEEKSESDLVNLEKGVRSYIILPIQYQENFLGLLLIGFSDKLATDDGKVKRLKQASEVISISINQLNLQKKLTQKTEDLLAGISYAKYIQKSVLPDIKGFSNYVKNLSLLYKPKDLVSGDFYWCKETEEHVFIAIADCTGHGVPGAFLTIIGVNLLDQIVGNEKISDPSQILTIMDRRMYDLLHRNKQSSSIDDGMEIALCVFDKKEHTMTYSGAGLGVLYFKEGEEIHIRGQRTSIASHRKEAFTFENSSIQVDGSEYFYMASDGYQDQLGGERFKRFSKNKLIRLLDQHKELPAAELESLLLDTITHYRKDYTQIDDYTVLGFQINTKKL
ncbi:MAG: PAS domain S-box protein [Bacteroidetes bacterium]|nr:MAG: PAS domain S-box protein [Bacteroidota bacterium]